MSDIILMKAPYGATNNRLSKYAIVSFIFIRIADIAEGRIFVYGFGEGRPFIKVEYMLLMEEYFCMWGWVHLNYKFE
ncbi:hypothetical protein ATY39_13765 [Rummeliibacillus stabekisii]|uniref:Uncharacterized protein n=1 Tax=Rummeliibacillus stabekisii TaxID=241244 RepID=A0A143HFS4_9BACL|nr:hypothetical protein ATY39_13460 [Rummeliibacillus stabekisii]AMX00386.1 hypothetical protein ATY39_13765 [Rummeliibacillus stabekisii]